MPQQAPESKRVRPGIPKLAQEESEADFSDFFRTPGCTHLGLFLRLGLPAEVLGGRALLDSFQTRSGLEALQKVLETLVPSARGVCPREAIMAFRHYLGAGPTCLITRTDGASPEPSP